MLCRLSHDAGAEVTLLEARDKGRHQAVRDAEEVVKQGKQTLQAAADAVKSSKQAVVTAQEQLDAASSNSTEVLTTEEIDARQAEVERLTNSLVAARAKAIQTGEAHSAAEKSMEKAQQALDRAKNQSVAENQAIQEVYRKGVARRAQARIVAWNATCKKMVWNQLRVRALRHVWGNSMQRPNVTQPGLQAIEGALQLVIHEVSSMATDLHMAYVQADPIYKELTSARQQAQDLRSREQAAYELMLLEYKGTEEMPDAEALDEFRRALQVDASDLSLADANEAAALRKVQDQVERISKLMLDMLQAKWKAEQSYMEARQRFQQLQVLLCGTLSLFPHCLW